MLKESEKDVLDEDIQSPDDTTDWETRAKDLENRIGRARDSRKAMKDKYEFEVAGLKAQLELKGAPETKEPKPDDKLLERLDKMALQVAGITEVDEVELFIKLKKKKKLMILKEVKASQVRKALHSFG